MPSMSHLAGQYRLLATDLRYSSEQFDLAGRLLESNRLEQAEMAIRRGLEGLQRGVEEVPRSEPVEV